MPPASPLEPEPRIGGDATPQVSTGWGQVVDFSLRPSGRRVYLRSPLRSRKVMSGTLFVRGGGKTYG